MASRGRGRGFGRGGGGFGHAVQTRFELFPDVELPDPNMVPVERNIIQWNTRLLNYWKSSPYYLEDAMQKKSQNADIERYSDLIKPKTSASRDSIYQILQINSSNFPEELVKDSRPRQKRKRVKWNAGMDKLDDFLDHIDQKYQDDGETDEKEKKEGEDEEENDNEELEEAEEEFSDDGDYNQNRDFDDDEDDFNMDDGDDEPEY